MILFKIIKLVIPDSLYLPLLYYYLKSCGKLDNDILLLKNIVSTRIRAIDIGSNMGIYSYALSKVFQNVESFEPMDIINRHLKAYTSIEKKITIHNVALSHKNEETHFYIPFITGKKELNFGLGSVIDPGGDREVFKVSVRCLDDYNFQKVGFIKIDTEGNELDVIKGALSTIKRDLPVILIEIEQRHLKDHSIIDVFDSILSLGYQGSFLLNNKKIPLNNFSYEQHQKPYLNNVYSKNYVNNFWFTPICD
jgi:FkbM family methyltransferase